MSWLLTVRELEDARGAVRRGEVTPPLYAFLGRLVLALGRARVLAPTLSPTGRWDDEAAEEVLHDWLAEKLLAGGLLAAFDAATTPRTLSRYLEASLRNWLVSKSRRRHGPRLLVRTRDILEREPRYRKFRPASSRLDEWWGLAEWTEPSPYQRGDEELVRAAFALGDFALIRYSAGSVQADPVISNQDLDRLLAGVFEQVEALLTLRHLDAMLRGRFGFAFIDTVLELEEAPEPEAPAPEPGEALAIQETAREILSEVSARQLSMFRDRLRERLTLEQLAERYGVSRGTADNELKRIGAIARAHTLNDDRYDEVLEMLVELAFREEGQG